VTKFTESDFRNCMGCYTTGITVVTMTDENNTPHGITINSFSSVSLSPPLVLFSLEKQANTYQYFLNTKSFAVNILAEDQKDISMNFAHPTTAKWDNIKHHSGNNNCPIIEDVLAYTECDIEQIYDGGDHSIIIGRVTDLKILSDGRPLLYNRGKYTLLGKEV